MQLMQYEASVFRLKHVNEENPMSQTLCVVFFLPATICFPLGDQLKQLMFAAGGSVQQSTLPVAASTMKSAAAPLE